MKEIIQDILLGFITALLFSAFIYLAEYGVVIKWFNTLLGLSALAALLYIPKRAVLSAGFFIGLLWFYWIGYSFEYQGVGYMQPIVTFGFGIIYLLFFAPLALSDKAYIRAIVLFCLSFFEPFDWNWLKIELVFVESYLGIYKYQLVLILAGLSLFTLIRSPWRYVVSLFLIVSAIHIPTPPTPLAPLKIKLVQTEIPQELKWQPFELYPTVKMVYDEIVKAKDAGYDVVVFPESVFPIFMNKNPDIMQQLQQFSKDISIVAGSLLYENEQNYNVTYLFEKGKIHIAKKLVLVPFGEYIPLPKFAQQFINETFFSGASDFVTAKHPTDFIIRGVKFRNAICYEATCDEIYKGRIKYVIATSNNAWFAPSIEPVLQHLLMRFYAKKYGVTIYHSANYKGTGIIQG